MIELDAIMRVEIDPDARYILVCEGSKDVASVQVLAKALKDWWKSDDQFFVLGVVKGTVVRFERLPRREE